MPSNYDSDISIWSSRLIQSEYHMLSIILRNLPYSRANKMYWKELLHRDKNVIKKDVYKSILKTRKRSFTKNLLLYVSLEYFLIIFFRVIRKFPKTALYKYQTSLNSWLSRYKKKLCCSMMVTINVLRVRLSQFGREDLYAQEFFLLTIQNEPWCLSAVYTLQTFVTFEKIRKHEENPIQRAIRLQAFLH